MAVLQTLEVSFDVGNGPHTKIGVKESGVRLRTSLSVRERPSIPADFLRHPPQDR